jgi:hypothetical protein
VATKNIQSGHANKLTNLVQKPSINIGDIMIRKISGKQVMKTAILAICSATFLVACAKPPSKIPAIAVASAEYSDMSCTALMREYTDVSNKLNENERKQRNRVAGDAAGVWFILIPPSTMSGDFAAEVGRYKGEKIAVERTIDKKNCT